MTMHKALLLVPLCAAACSTPRFSATKTVEMELPAAQLSRLRCTSHNGDITVTKGESDDTIQLRAEMKVRGHTQEEADENLHLLSIGQQTDGDELRLFGEYPRSELSNRSPSFTFTLQVPARLALALESHNGDIATRGTTGALSAETHNGDIEGSVANTQVTIETHNGNIDLAIDSADELAGKLTSHNGNVLVSLQDGASGWLEAHTHNGSITPPAQVMDATIERRSLRCRVGEQAGDGKLVVETHNGNVEIRTSPSRTVDRR